MELGTIFTLDEYAEAYAYAVKNGCKIEEIEPTTGLVVEQYEEIEQQTVIETDEDGNEREVIVDVPVIKEREVMKEIRRYQIVAIPEPTIEEQQARVRAKRNAMLDATDKYVSVPDFPIDESTRNLYIEYRVYLRDYTTAAENWWESVPLSYEEWLEK